MLFALIGDLVEKTPVNAVLNCNGVCYDLNISLATYSLLPQSGKVQLYTHLHVNGNDFSLVLYGFGTTQEKELFKQLISVSGVGPNTARMVLSSLSVSELIQVIASKEVAALKRIKGIGEKTAQRIVLELRDKLGSGKKTSAMVAISGSQNEAYEQALLALTTLGYVKASAEKALLKITKELGHEASVEELIKNSLKIL